MAEHHSSDKGDEYQSDHIHSCDRDHRGSTCTSRGTARSRACGTSVVTMTITYQAAAAEEHRGIWLPSWCHAHWYQPAESPPVSTARHFQTRRSGHGLRKRHRNVHLDGSTLRRVIPAPGLQSRCDRTCSGSARAGHAHGTVAMALRVITESHVGHRREVRIRRHNITYILPSAVGFVDILKPSTAVFPIGFVVMLCE